MQTSIPCTIIRGGTSKGLYFIADDLPADEATCFAVVRRAVGSPDVRQIDGLGGAHPLTSKVAVVGPSTRPDADVDYLFLQVAVETGEISTSQNCGNILAGIGPFAIERGLVAAARGMTEVRIHMVNSGSIAVASVRTPGGVVTYEGDAQIDGVPGSASPIMLEFVDTAGATCGALLPTGAVRDSFDGLDVTCIDAGMPVILIRAADLGKSGYESPGELESDAALRATVERIRVTLAPQMNLGDVTHKTIPKICLLAPPQRHGVVCTRTFIPHRVHEAIGVLGAVSVASAAVVPGSVAAEVSCLEAVPGRRQLAIEHPTGSFAVELDVDYQDGFPHLKRPALLRTARKLMQGDVFVPESTWKRL